jgi:hypothetical protein
VTRLVAAVTVDPDNPGRVLLSGDGRDALGYLHFTQDGIAYRVVADPGDSREAWAKNNGAVLIASGKTRAVWEITDPIAVGKALRLDIAFAARRRGTQRRRGK